MAVSCGACCARHLLSAVGKYFKLILELGFDEEASWLIILVQDTNPPKGGSRFCSNRPPWWAVFICAQLHRGRRNWCGGTRISPLITAPTSKIVRYVEIALRHYPSIFSTSSASMSETSGIPLTLAASGVSAAMSLRVMCFRANLRAPHINCCNPCANRL